MKLHLQLSLLKDENQTLCFISRIFFLPKDKDVIIAQILIYFSRQHSKVSKNHR